MRILCTALSIQLLVHLESCCQVRVLWDANFWTAAESIINLKKTNFVMAVFQICPLEKRRNKGLRRNAINEKTGRRVHTHPPETHTHNTPTQRTHFRRPPRPPSPQGLPESAGGLPVQYEAPSAPPQICYKVSTLALCIISQKRNLSSFHHLFF